MVIPRARRWPSGSVSSISSSPTSTASDGWWPRAGSRPSWSSATPRSCGPASEWHTPAPNRLFLTAVDVVRDGTGSFRAIGDRAQAPSGLGYALVNRTILSRVLPNLHRESGVERLAGFFRSIRAGVAAVAPEGVDEPRVVILTPGPLSETYFEHAYLASYLGYALVEGRDLVVNNNRVWLRTLAGFDPVDVVIRRVDDQWCDPVELRADSLLGVPGLLEVARRGRVAVVNPLGAGVIEDPGAHRSAGRPGPGPAGRGAGPPRSGDLVVRATRPVSATSWPNSGTSSCCRSGRPPAQPPGGGLHALGGRARRTCATGSGPVREPGWARRSSSRRPPRR